MQERNGNWWVNSDSNRELIRYERSTLTIELLTQKICYTVTTVGFVPFTYCILPPTHTIELPSLQLVRRWFFISLRYCGYTLQGQQDNLALAE